MKIAVRTPNWLGDIAFNLPFIHKLSESYEVTIITKEGFAEIFEGYNTITFNSKKELYLKHIKLRGKFDAYIVTPLSFSSALASFLQGAPVRVGFSFDLRDPLLTKRIKIPKDWKEKHTTKTYALLYSEFIDISQVSFKLEVPTDYKEKAIKILKEHGILDNKFVSIAPFAQFGTAKEWHLPYILELAEILKKHNAKVLILGSKKDLERSKELAHENIVNLVGKTSIWEAVQIAKYSLAFIGGDSGLTHLSSLSGANTVAIFGPTPLSWTHPLGPKVKTVQATLSCIPCEKRECPKGTNECMKLIKPERVFELIRSYL